jgi:penicillin-insensitive murein endopeptidase
VQTGAIELPESGEGFVRYCSTGGQYWGQPALVEGIRDAARRVAGELPGGPALIVGDLSARFGGKIPRHHSHRSGRDVDLLWFVTTLEGIPVQNSSFVQLGHRGVGWIPGHGYVRLDIERQWRLIRALLTSPHADVQWLYSSSLVKGLLLEHARVTGEDADLLSRAQLVMQQPLDGLPHDDHLHLRIACPRQSLAQGCAGGGPDWAVIGAAAQLEPASDPDPNADRDDATASDVEANFGSGAAAPPGDEGGTAW